LILETEAQPETDIRPLIHNDTRDQSAGEEKSKQARLTEAPKLKQNRAEHSHYENHHSSNVFVGRFDSALDS
jgi:hypothetical protein